jgi:hypothetical protein
MHLTVAVRKEKRVASRPLTTPGCFVECVIKDKTCRLH